MEQKLKIKSEVGNVFNDEMQEWLWYIDLKDLIVKSDRICQVKQLEKIGKAIILPFETDLYSYSELVDFFQEETGIKISGKKVGNYLRAKGMYECFSAFRGDFKNQKFQDWCRRNDIEIEL